MNTKSRIEDDEEDKDVVKQYAHTTKERGDEVKEREDVIRKIHLSIFESKLVKNMKHFDVFYNVTTDKFFVEGHSTIYNTNITTDCTEHQALKWHIDAGKTIEKIKN